MEKNTVVMSGLYMSSKFTPLVLYLWQKMWKSDFIRYFLQTFKNIPNKIWMAILQTCVILGTRNIASQNCVLWILFD